MTLTARHLQLCNVHRREQDRCARCPQLLTLYLTTPHIFIHRSREVCALLFFSLRYQDILRL
jgi:hypothetical protein